MLCLETDCTKRGLLRAQRDGGHERLYRYGFLEAHGLGNGVQPPSTLRQMAINALLQSISNTAISERPYNGKCANKVGM